MTVALYRPIQQYKVQVLRGEEPIVSPTFPGLNLTAEQVLRAGL